MTTTERIKNILRASHAARNDHFELWLIYARKSGLSLSDEQLRVIERMPAFETIRRTCQKIQREGREYEEVHHGQKSPYTADLKTNDARFEKFKQVRQNIQSEDPEKLLESQGYKILPFGE